MSETKINYDKEGDVLYVSFGKSDHVTGIELADNIILRLDSGKATGEPPKAIGLTFINFSYTKKHFQDKPANVSLTNLRNLPEDMWQAVLTVITTPPVCDFLETGLSFSPHLPSLPEQITV